MANEALIYDIGADISSFKYSIKEVSAELNKLKATLKTAVGDEIITLNSQIAALETSLKNLKSAGVPAADTFSRVADSSKNARIALTSVNQVIQDLPFGFIGIQNNLPLLFQSFNKLSQESGGVVSAFKAIDKATLITSGLFLAFNITTAAITFLIQKYGSLSNASDALFGKTNLLAKAQEDYNKQLATSIGSSAKESSEISILTKTLTDLTKPLADRQAAYVELKKISPEVVAGLHLENISTAEAVSLISANAKAIQELLLLKAQEAAISNVLTKNKEDLAKLQIEESKLTKDQISAQLSYNKSKQDGFLVLGAGRTTQQTALIALNDASNALQKNRLEQDKLNKVADQYVKILEPTINSIAKIDLNTYKLTENLKEQDKKLKDVKESTSAYYKILRNLDKERIVPNIDIAPQLKDINFGKLVKKDQPFKIFDIASYQAAYDKLITKLSENPIKPQIDLQPIQLTSKQLSLKKLIESGGFNELEARFKKTKEIISSVFLQPLTDLFDNFFKTGKLSFKEFGKTILAEISKIASKLIATGIIELVSSLFNPAALLSSSVGAGSSSATSGILDNVIGKVIGAGAANFAGIQSGGMSMNGSVNLVLRGTDLVGSINRTNSQISRIG